MTNFKKLISILLLCVTLLSVFGINVLAEDSDETSLPSITVSEDYWTLKYNQNKFYLVDSSLMSIVRSVYYYEEDIDVEVLFSSEKQVEGISNVYAKICHKDDTKPWYIKLTIYYEKGKTVNLYYLRDIYADDLENVLSGKFDSAYVKGTKGTVELSRDHLSTYPIRSINVSEFYTNKTYPVYCNTDFEILTGYVIKMEDTDKYFYFDLAKSGLTPSIEPVAFFAESLRGFYLNDSELVSKLDAATSSDSSIENMDDLVYSDAMGVISIVLMSLGAGLLPFAISIFCAIRATKAKAPYKAMLRALAIICALVVVFVIMIIVFSLL